MDEMDGLMFYGTNGSFNEIHDRLGCWGVSGGPSAKFVAFGEACAGHGFSEPAILQKCPFELANLLVQEIVRLVDNADDNVGDDFGGPRFDDGAKNVVERTSQIGRMPGIAPGSPTLLI